MRRFAVGLSLVIATIAASLISAPAQAESIWSTLRASDGVVILYRHALAPGGGDPSNFRLGDCATQRNLSDAGRDQARAMGRELRSERVPVSRVLASPWCRSRETAELLDVGDATTLRRLGSVFQSDSSVAAKRERLTRRLIDRHRDRVGVLVIVGHQANIIDLTGVAPASGEGVVVRADRDGGGLRVLGRVPPPPVR